MTHIQYKEFFDAAPVAMVITDRSGAIKFMNRQATALLGYSSSGSQAPNLCDFINISPLKGKTGKLSFREFMTIHSQHSRQWIVGSEGKKIYTELNADSCFQGIEFRYIWSLVPVTPATNIAYDLNERVKEQLSIANVIDAFFKNTDLRTALDHSLNAIRKGWQFPEATGVRVRLNNMDEFVTDDFWPTQWQLQEDIITANKYLGSLEVCCLAEVPETKGRVFLPEEERLVKLLAKLLGILIDHWQSENKIRQTESNLNAVFESSTEGYLLADQEFNITAFNARARDLILVNTNKYELETGRNVRDYL
ncbi:MAG TPA: PAS domain-containing protein, partial [Sphingobacteriaceae bacterium]